MRAKHSGHFRGLRSALEHDPQVIRALRLTQARRFIGGGEGNLGW